MSEQAPAIVGNAIALVVVAPFVVWLTTWELAVIALPAITVLALALFFLRRYLTKRMRGAHDAALAMVDESSSLLRGHLELAAASRLDQQARKMADRAYDYSDAVRRSERASSIGGRIPMLAAGSLALFLGWLWLGDRPELLESGLVKVLVIGSVLPIVGGIARSISEAHRNLREIAPVVELLDVPEAPRSKPNAVKLDPNQAIRFHNVSFAYGDAGGFGNPPLHDGVGAPGCRGAAGGSAKQVCDLGGTAKQAEKRKQDVLGRGDETLGEQDNLALPPTALTWRPKEFLAITGPNGTGKSTLVRLLLRLADPKEGAIYVGATDLREGDTDAWRKSIAYLPQRPYLPEGFSLRSVLRTFGPDIDEALIVDALKTVGLLPKLHRYHPSDPLDAKVAMLSAGERQRFALARVLADPAPVLILDEPDANLDAAGLERLISDLPGLSKDRRILLVAHDRRLLACADRVVELGSKRGLASATAASH